MSTTRKRSNVVAKALLLTALASGIAGMQATHVNAASKDIGGNSLNYFTYKCYNQWQLYRKRRFYRRRQPDRQG